MMEGPTDSLALQLRRTDGTWVTVDQAPAAVGDDKGDAPFLAAQFTTAMAATAMRLVGTGDQPGATLSATDTVALAVTP
jgi:hypothetical protein